MNRTESGPGRLQLERRAFLAGAAVPLAGAVLGAPPPMSSEPARTAAPAPVIRQRRPDNLEFPFASLDSFLTPNHLFYVRTHFEVPHLDAAAWRLQVDGAVKKPLEVSLDDLRKMKRHTMPALLECSGNGRVFLDPPQVGIRWQLGGVSNAEWTGVRLADLLERAGVKDEAVEVILEGADRGEIRRPNPESHGVIPYARSLPLDKARRPEVLLAYQMNGKDLPAAHGHPVRAVVAGWYGMASVKWLKRITVSSRPFHGYFQTMMYAVWERRQGQRTLVPVTEMQVKAQVARPASGEVVPAGSKYRVFGAAWAGESEVQTVEVSTDGGKTWARASLLQKAVPFAWRFWEYPWDVPERPGRRVVMARATDRRGRTQPASRDRDRRDAMISHVLPAEVEVG